MNLAPSVRGFEKPGSTRKVEDVEQQGGPGWEPLKTLSLFISTEQGTSFRASVGQVPWSQARCSLLPETPRRLEVVKNRKMCPSWVRCWPWRLTCKEISHSPCRPCIYCCRRITNGNDDDMQVFVSYKDLNCVLAKVDSQVPSPVDKRDRKNVRMGVRSLLVAVPCTPFRADVQNRWGLFRRSPTLSG